MEAFLIDEGCKNKNGCFLFFIVLFSYSIQSESLDCYDPLLVVVIMVKNEEMVMHATLQPFVEGGVDSFFVLDTGSTDRTVAVTKGFFLNTVLSRHTLRKNRLLILPPRVIVRLIWRKKSSLKQLLCLCLMRNGISMMRARSLILSVMFTAWRYLSFLFGGIVNQSCARYTCRLIRCNYGVRFAGVVHETVVRKHRLKCRIIFFLIIHQQPLVLRRHMRHLLEIVSCYITHTKKILLMPVRCFILHVRAKI